MSGPIDVGFGAPTPEMKSLAEFTGIRGDVDAGLSQLLTEGRTGHGFAELTAGASTGSGAFVRAQAGFLPRPDLALFAFGQADTVSGGQAGLGARFTF